MKSAFITAERLLPPCAFCGGKTSLSEDLQHVEHSLPTCTKFDDSTSAAFLVACAEEWEKKTQASNARCRELRELESFLKIYGPPIPARDGS